MTASLKDKRILITGAGSGIGRATSLKLHEFGAHVFLTDINLDGVHETQKRCASQASTAATSSAQLNVADKTAVEAYVASITTDGAEIDHVFNCAGVNPTSYKLEETTDEYWDKLMSVNLRGVYNVTRATIPHMASPGGSYVNVSSINGVHAYANQAIYCATKWGLIGFSKSMALELGPRGIRTNVVAPGCIDTPTNAGIVKGGEYVERMAKGNSLGRLGQPDEVADVVAFLMSDAARYMNGSVLEIDGGLKG
ncbi:short-chain dehydrogenase/reductase-like protein SDR [Phyllosticta citriasiana]|uniref:short-chain dehydrogenase/reductase-like protein SDR n=1 Tax=Phyllosticta citriasiana TaxID=595635 RepID=UPI0030FDDB16